MNDMKTGELTYRWTELSPAVHAQWDLLTPRDLTAIAGRRATLVALLQERYAMSKDAAEADVVAFEGRVLQSRQSKREHAAAVARQEAATSAEPPPTA